MSWLFSRALAAEYSAEFCSAGEPFAPSKTTLTPAGFCSLDKMTELSRLSRFGMTFELLTDDRGKELLTLYLAAGHARTYPLPAAGRGSAGSGLDSGKSSLASLAKYDRESSSWKTLQPSLHGDSERFSGTWPRSGTEWNGECWERAKLAPPTSAKGSGPLLPTPAANRYGTDRGGGMGRTGKVRPSLQTMAARDLWPTPTVRDGRSGKASQATMERNSRPLSEVAGGLLNPTWVESYLMGWPDGWTDFAALETAKFRVWRRLHSIY